MKKITFFLFLVITALFTTCTLFNNKEVIINDIGKIPERAPYYIDVVCDAGKKLIKLIYEDGVFPEINEGDILAGTKDDGYLIKVESKEKSGDTLIINGSSASLEEVIEKGFVDSSVALTVDLTKSLKALNTQCKLKDKRGTEYTANVTSSTPTLEKMSENVFELTFTNIKLTFLSNSSSIEIPELRYKFDMDYNFALQYDNGLKEFKSVLTTTDSILFDEIELNLVDIEGDIDVVEMQLWKPVFTPIVFYIGAWPIVVTPELSVSLKGILSSSESASLLIPVNLSIGKEETVGIEYTEDGGWSPVWDYDFSISGQMDSTDFKEDFNTTQKVGLFGKFGLKLYGALGCGLNIGLYGYNKYINNTDGSTATWVDTMGVIADAGVQFGIGDEIGGLVKISLTLLGYEHTFESVKRTFLYFNNTIYYDGLPEVNAYPATNVTASSAQLNGTVEPNDYATTYHFEWDSTINFTYMTPDSSAGSGTSVVPVSYNLTGLSPKTTYYYRIVATNRAGWSYGNFASFTTNDSMELSETMHKTVNR